MFLPNQVTDVDHTHWLILPTETFFFFPQVASCHSTLTSWSIMFLYLKLWPTQIATSQCSYEIDNSHGEEKDLIGRRFVVLSHYFWVKRFVVDYALYSSRKWQRFFMSFLICMALHPTSMILHHLLPPTFPVFVSFFRIFYDFLAITFAFRNCSFEGSGESYLVFFDLLLKQHKKTEELLLHFDPFNVYELGSSWIVNCLV